MARLARQRGVATQLELLLSFETARNLCVTQALIFNIFYTRKVSFSFFHRIKLLIYKLGIGEGR